jgi:acyltransferase-like protein
MRVAGDSDSRRPPGRVVLWAFERYVRSQVARHFGSARLGPGDHPGVRWDRSLPTLFIANHTNWWDGFLAFLVGRELGLTSYVLMDALQLERYPAFRLVGALPLARHPFRQARRHLLAAAGRLGPGTGLWVFPQGGRRPQGERPSSLAGGAAEIALTRGGPIRICAVAFRYLYLSEQLPEAFAWIGRSWVLEPAAYSHRRRLTPAFERDLLVAVDALDTVLRAERLGGFQTIVEGRLSVNKRMDRVRHAVGLLRGRFEPRNG